MKKAPMLNKKCNIYTIDAAKECMIKHPAIVALGTESYRWHSITTASLIRVTLARREIIRYARDQIGDDRCFLDDYLIWELVRGLPKTPRFSEEEGMRQCVLFYENRRTETPDEPYSDVQPESWRLDENFLNAPREWVVQELNMVQLAIVEHHDGPIREHRPRTVHDDRKLYKTALPESKPADFRLPPRENFLVSINASSGCPAFWKSHAGCRSLVCNLHKWGPCKTQSKYQK